MAWHPITYRCGHTGREQIYGPVKNRDNIATYRGRALCPACWEAEREAERAQASAEAAAWAEAMGLPPLAGTPKQIAYGETCRRRILDDLEHWSESQQALAAPLLAQTAAHWWIEMTPDRWAATLHAEATQPTPAIPATVETALAAETTIQPENPYTNLVAAITLQGDQVQVQFPERHEALRGLLRTLYFEWTGTAWVRSLTPYSGSAIDRATEAAHRILALGIPIRVAEAAIREAAITGTYAPECRRWIKARLDGSYVGWLVITWDRTDDCYGAARRLPGSRYDRPHVIVPPESWEEVLDFAAQHQFALSAKAQTIIETARLHKAQMLRVAVPVPIDVRPQSATGRPPILAIPEEVTIDEAFRDDDGPLAPSAASRQ